MQDELRYFNYEAMPGHVQSIYDTIYAGLRSGCQSVSFEADSTDDVYEAYKGMVYDHPELFWLSGGYSLTSNGTNCELHPKTTVPWGSLARFRSRFEQKIERIISGVRVVGDPYDAILKLHDYIVEHSDYDHKARANYRTNPLAGTAYGCIVENNAVCAGYSKGFQTLLNRIGVSCGYATGDCKGGEPHAWSYVLYYGQFYYVDVTFDDPTQAKSKYDNKSHRYFFITEKDISHTRTIDRSESFVPECKDDHNNYFIRKGLYFDSYSTELIKTAAKRCHDRKLEIRFADEYTFSDAVRGLIHERQWVNVFGGSSISYSTDEDLYVLTFNF